MIFVTNDSFSELVWSPHRGLTIRCAKSSFFWGAELSDMVLSPPQNIGTGTDHENDSNQAVDQTASLRSSDKNKPTFQSGSCDSINTSPRINRVQDDVLNQGDTVAVDEAIESDSRVLEDTRTKNVLPDSDDLGDKLECVAENELLPSDNMVGGAKQVQLEVCEISKACPIRALASKGKEKALSDDDDGVKKGVSQEDDDSDESVESCNSAKLFSAGKKRVRSFEEQLIDGSKRVKMRVRETPGSSSFTRSNSSFANWISTMVKGISRPDEGGNNSLALTSTVNENKAFDTFSREQDKPSDNMGFQSLFQSIYRQNQKVQDARLLCSDKHQEIEGCKELNSSRDDLLALEDNTSKSLNQEACEPLDSKATKGFWLNMDSTATRNVGSSRNLIAGKRATDIFGRSCSDLPSAEKAVNTSVKKDDHFSGSFMNHFCPKSPRPAMDSQRNIGCFEDTEEPTNLSAVKKLHNFPVDVEASSANTIQTVQLQRFTSSEAMASVFAKRLDALKNILRSDLTNKSASSATTCFFCGITGHDLRHCPQVTETEVEELLRNLAAYGGREESPCLCIRCFQLNHWAANCPNAPSRKKNKVEIWHQKGFGVKASSNLHNVNAEKYEENASQLPGFPYPCGSLATLAFTMPKGIFEAVKSLRLSRNDIIKWMNSIFSTSLDGYYLRLRRKLGEGQGGTQYNVACICGPQEGKSETSKRPISVIVDGIRCSVETQYISNQDFLEDELKTWWSATLKGDGKIPSEDELRSKVEERRRLGL